MYMYLYFFVILEFFFFPFPIYNSLYIISFNSAQTEERCHGSLKLEALITHLPLLNSKYVSYCDLGVILISNKNNNPIVMSVNATSFIIENSEIWTV